MFWVAIVIFAAGVILYILELSDSKAYKAFTGAISTLAAIVAIISAINPYWIDSLLPENTPTDDTFQESPSKPVTYYRYREMEYTTSTTPQLDGWELYGTTQENGDFGEWSPWQYEYIASTDVLEVETTTHYRSREISETVEYGPWSEWTSEPKDTLKDNEIEESDTVYWYGYYYFECPNCHAHMHGWDITCPVWAGGCGQAYIPENSWHEIHSTTSWDEAGLEDWGGTGKYYAIIGEELCFQWDRTGEDHFYRYREYWVNQQAGEWSAFTDQYISLTENTEVEQVTAYRYRVRTSTTVYMFRRWGEWSDWSETKRESSDTVDVESITR